MNTNQKLHNTLQPFVDSGSLVGAVALVADADHTIAEAAVGFADVRAKQAMRADTLFWIASQTKPITASALMMPVDAGMVSVDDPVAKYLPEFEDLWVKEEQADGSLRLTRPEHPVTLREVLSHTAGMPFKSAMEQPTLDMLPLDIAVRSYAMTPLDRQPGGDYAYSNAGINTAGRIVEVVAECGYERFLQERIFGPLGMTDTTFRPSEEQQARLAKSYAPNSDGSSYDEVRIGQLTYPLDDPRRQPVPGGGLFSTAADVARFVQMILRGGRSASGQMMLSPAAIGQMTTKQTPPSVEVSYGLGWSVGTDSYGHGGAHSTCMTVYPKAGIATVYLVQHNGFIANGATAWDAFAAAALAL